MVRGRYIFAVVLLILAGLNSCDRGFEELNQNPNIPPTGNPDELFANAVYRYHTNYEHGVLTEIWGLQIWNQAMADINGIGAGNDYFLGGDAIDNSWRLLYSEVLGNTAEAIRLVEGDPEQQNKEAIFRIFRAYVFQRITDLWGDVPYSEAHGAAGTTSPNFTPAYDQQADIYNDLLAELQASSALLDERSATLDGHDWYFNGDVSKWRKFANTLRLKLALRMSNVDPETARNEIEALAGAELISAQEDGVHFPHADFARNPFYQLDFTGQGMRNPSEFLIDLLKNDQDPRITVFAEPTPFSLIVLGVPDYEGVPSFLLTSEIDPDDLNDFTTSEVGSFFLDVDMPGTTLGYAESCFLQAEAALRGWGSGDAEILYEAGVRAHMERLAIPDSSITQYLENSGSFDQTLEQIITEKWKTFVYTDAIEAFNEYRRTGFPVLTNRDGQPVDQNLFPKRIAYPDIEISFNGSQLGAVVADPKDVQNPVWWDTP